MLSSLLILSVIGLMVLALFDYTERGLIGRTNPAGLDESLSLGVSLVLYSRLPSEPFLFTLHQPR